MAVGNKVSLDFDGDQLLNLTFDAGALKGSVNNSGMIQAQSVHHVNGVIRLEGGSVTHSGTLDASGKGAGEGGGSVVLRADSDAKVQVPLLSVPMARWLPTEPLLFITIQLRR